MQRRPIQTEPRSSKEVKAQVSYLSSCLLVMPPSPFSIHMFPSLARTRVFSVKSKRVGGCSSRFFCVFFFQEMRVFEALLSSVIGVL